mmetsp:Transcript_4075/g.11100  ORF Transcript_4075/g.11100 Transcript_4075/m.11100 type:complete len:228 (-) Transcript_4075:245-928(-)
MPSWEKRRLPWRPPLLVQMSTWHNIWLIVFSRRHRCVGTCFPAPVAIGPIAPFLMTLIPTPVRFGCVEGVAKASRAASCTASILGCWRDFTTRITIETSTLQHIKKETFPVWQVLLLRQVVNLCVPTPGVPNDKEQRVQTPLPISRPRVVAQSLSRIILRILGRPSRRLTASRKRWTFPLKSGVHTRTETRRCSTFRILSNVTMPWPRLFDGKMWWTCTSSQRRLSE